MLALVKIILAEGRIREVEKEELEEALLKISFTDVVILKFRSLSALWPKKFSSVIYPNQAMGKILETIALQVWHSSILFLERFKELSRNFELISSVTDKQIR